MIHIELWGNDGRVADVYDPRGTGYIIMPWSKYAEAKGRIFSGAVLNMKNDIKEGG